MPLICFHFYKVPTGIDHAHKKIMPEGYSRLSTMPFGCLRLLLLSIV